MQDESLRKVMRSIEAALRPIHRDHPRIALTALMLLCRMPVRSRSALSIKADLPFQKVNHHVNTLIEIGWVKELPRTSKGDPSGHLGRPLELTDEGKAVFAHLLPKEEKAALTA